MDSITYNVKYRYSDDRDFRLHACGIKTFSQLQNIVSGLVGLTGVEDIHIGYDLCFTDFKLFCP